VASAAAPSQHRMLLPRSRRVRPCKARIPSQMLCVWPARRPSPLAVTVATRAEVRPHTTNRSRTTSRGCNEENHIAFTLLCEPIVAVLPTRALIVDQRLHGAASLHFVPDNAPATATSAATFMCLCRWPGCACPVNAHQATGNGQRRHQHIMSKPLLPQSITDESMQSPRAAMRGISISIIIYRPVSPK
jgi:hypothetical protein